MMVPSVKVFSGSGVQVIQPDKTLADLAEQIKGAYTCQVEAGKRAIEAIIRVGQLCAKARDYINGRDNAGLYHARLEQLTGLSKSSISKYIAIASSPVISDRKNHTHLPSSVFNLYEIAKVEDQENVQAAIDSGKIAPDLNRTSLAEAISNVADKIKTQTKALAPITRSNVDAFTISLPAKTWQRTYKDFEQDLLRLLDRYQAELKYGRTVHVTKVEDLAKLAEQQFQKLSSKIPDDARRLGNLVDNAIVECKKNGARVTDAIGKPQRQLPSDWKWASRVRKELGINDPIYLSAIYKQARSKKIVCKQVSLGSVDREIDLWLALLNICNNNQKTALKKKLQKKSEVVLKGAKATPQAKRLKEVAGNIYAMVKYL